MTNQPIVWHYGLMAERWAKTINETPELAYFERQIGRFGQPVLDLACGVGRLLMPLLRAGIAIDGCDISEDMLAYPAARAGEEGLAAHLYAQQMHELDLPRRYKTIYICDSFGLSGSRANDLETLRRCYEHLQYGGALLFNIQPEYTSPEDWAVWVPDGRSDLPEPWPEEGSRRTAADGSENIAYFRSLELDPLEQTFVNEVRLEKVVRGVITATEQYTLKGNMYFKNEVLLMLQAAGFSDISVTGDYSDQPATSTSKEILFTAIK
jgi:SAM-dependent methyltransferase